MLKIPRFFHFKLDESGTDYLTTHMMENATYTTISAVWDDLLVTGLLPIMLLIYFYLRIYLQVCTCNYIREEKGDYHVSVYHTCIWTNIVA